MAPSFADIIQSGQFKFLVGKDQTPIVVHAAALAATSTQIDRLMNGHMEEARNQCAELRDINVDDFTRFCEYAYRGDYAAPAITPRPGPAADHEEPEPIPLDDWSTFGIKKDKKDKKVRPNMFNALRETYRSRDYLSRQVYEARAKAHFYPQPNTTDKQDFTPVLLAHARLYAFARVRLVADLKALTLAKLHRELVSFQLYENQVGTIIELARYAYSNDCIPDRDDDGKIDELRDLVVNYIVSEFDIIGKSSAFITFLEEGGELVGDLCSILVDGLTSVMALSVSITTPRSDQTLRSSLLRTDKISQS